MRLTLSFYILPQVAYTRLPEVQWSQPYTDLVITVQDTGMTRGVTHGVTRGSHTHHSQAAVQQQLYSHALVDHTIHCIALPCLALYIPIRLLTD